MDNSKRVVTDEEKAMMQAAKDRATVASRPFFVVQTKRQGNKAILGVRDSQHYRPHRPFDTILYIEFSRRVSQ